MNLRHSCVVGLSAVLFALPGPAQAFFNNPTRACNVHQRRLVEPFTLAPTFTNRWHELLAFRELCYVERYVQLKASAPVCVDEFSPPECVDPKAFFPDADELYPGFSNTEGKCDAVKSLLDHSNGSQATWPVCYDGVPDSCEDDEAPDGCAWDFGWRYPRRHAPPSLPASDYQPEGDSWPICASADLSVVRSYPGTSSCDEAPNNAGGVAVEEIGRCVASAHYYEVLGGGPMGTDPASFHYSFELNPDHCPPCASDVGSVVSVCKSLCDRYFGGLVYDPAIHEFRPVGPNDDPMGDTAGMEPPTDHFPYDVTLLAECRDACGPPYETDLAVSQDPPGPKSAIPDPHVTPPWMSTKVGTARHPAEKDNHWRFVAYERWRPSDNPAGFLRSYNNIDSKPHSPVQACGDLVDHYCDTDPLIPASERDPCKEKRWSDDDYPDANGDGVPDAVFEDPFDDDTHGFCQKFYRGRPLCRETCANYSYANTQETEGWHVCGGDAMPKEQTGPQLDNTPGDLPLGVIEPDKLDYTCGKLSASCELKTVTSNACPETGPTKWNKALCRDVTILAPKRSTDPTAAVPVTPLNGNQVPVLALYLDGYARSVGLIDGVFNTTYYSPPTPPTFTVKNQASAVTQQGNLEWTIFGWAAVVTVTPGQINTISVMFPRWPNEPGNGINDATSSVKVQPVS
jgi:hypothetical protein